MSKLNVNELEANGTNSNLKVVSKDTTGTCEITGADNDGTLQLNCSAQSHGVKLKAPADSAGQNYTLALPDNQIAANKLLKIKSITGSGTTAEGQLEFVDTPPTAYTNLDAANITSGTLSSSRLAGFAPSNGASLQLISHQQLTSGQTAATIDFTGLEDNAVYFIKAKDVKLSHNTNTGIYVKFLDSTGSHTAGVGANYQTVTVDKIGHDNSIVYNHSVNYGVMARERWGQTNRFRFNGYLMVSAGYVFYWSEGMSTDRVNSDVYAYGQPFRMTMNLRSNLGNYRVHGIRFEAPSGIATFADPTEISLYKYAEE